MKRTTRTIQEASLLLLLIFTISSIALPAYAQLADVSPTTELPQNHEPSEVYYEHNMIQLRGEWDEEPDPGGSEEGGNEWVGAPLGDGILAISLATGVYLLFAFLRRKESTKRTNKKV